MRFKVRADCSRKVDVLGNFESRPNRIQILSVDRKSDKVASSGNREIRIEVSLKVRKNAGYGL